MIFIFFRKILLMTLLLVSSYASGNDFNSNRIEVLVNENIITKYDIIQRLKINSILKRIEINDDNYNQLLNTVIDDLIIEKLKIGKIEEYDINIDNVELKQHKKRFLSSLNYKMDELEELFLINDVKYNYFNMFIEVDLKWQKLIYGLYLRVSSVTKQEINDLISKNPNLNEDSASDLILQRQLDLKSMKLIKDLRDEATIEYK